MNQVVHRVLYLTLALTVHLACPPAARAQLQGFQLNRYEPTPAGEESFAVDHPRYSASGELTVGLTLDYSHNPLLAGGQTRDGASDRGDAIIAHQLVGHLDLAAAMLNRGILSLSLPVRLIESGEPGNAITATGGSAGDPRLGLMFRIYGQPERSRLSISLGGYLWVPLRKFTDQLPQQAGDQEVRGLPKLVLAGRTGRWRWSSTLGVLLRADSVLGSPQLVDGSSTGTSLQLGELLQYADGPRGFAVGVEVLLDAVVTGGHGFQSDYTGLELLLGGHYRLLRQLQLGLATGLGFLSAPGTPDARLLLRFAYVLPDILAPPRRAPGGT